jgi:hypothetical protein
MDIKYYVSLEAARLLKEKGYNKECNYYFVENENRIIYVSDYVINADFAEWRRKAYTAHSKAEAIDWLDSKGTVVEIWRPNFSTGWACSVEKNRILEYDSWMKDDILFPTRLEAEEAAIIKALELL